MYISYCQWITELTDNIIGTDTWLVHVIAAHADMTFLLKLLGFTFHTDKCNEEPIL